MLQKFALGAKKMMKNGNGARGVGVCKTCVVSRRRDTCFKSGVLSERCTDKSPMLVQKVSSAREWLTNVEFAETVFKNTVKSAHLLSTILRIYTILEKNGTAREVSHLLSFILREF